MFAARGETPLRTKLWAWAISSSSMDIGVCAATWKIKSTATTDSFNMMFRVKSGVLFKILAFNLRIELQWSASSSPFLPGRMPHPVGGAVGMTLHVLTWVKRLPKTGAGNYKPIWLQSSFPIGASFTVWVECACAPSVRCTELPGHITAGKQAVELQLLNTTA